MLAVTNGHAITSDIPNPSGETQFGAQVGYKGQFLNFIYGGVSPGIDDGLLNDYTGGFDLTDSFYVGINAAYAYSEDDAAAGYQGAALYLQNSFSESLAIGLRPEFFSLTYDELDDEDVTALTLTGNYTLDSNLTFIAELRYDDSEDGIIEGYPGEDLSTLTFAAVYSF